MKTKTLLTVLSYVTTTFVACTLCRGQNNSSQQTAATTQQTFQSVATQMSGLRPWIGETALNDAQQSVLAQLRQMAIQIVNQTDYAQATLALLDQYKNDDGWVRQSILSAVFSGRTYNTEDLPFLKQLLSASAGYRYEHFRYKMRGWSTPGGIRRNLAWRILTLTKQPDLDHNPDRALLETDPVAWLAKYAP